MSKKSGYIYEIHYLRAIACLMVLLVHVSGAFYYENGEKFNEVTLFINQISRFGTPMFALISAFLLFKSSFSRGLNIKRFYKSRVTKVGLPFLIWSVFYLAFWYVMNGINPFEKGLKMFAVDFLFGNSFYHLYFMSIVFQFYIIFPVLQLFRSSKVWIAMLAGAALVNIYFLTGYNPGRFDGILGTILSQRAFLPSWIFFFMFGGFLALFWNSILEFSRKHIRWLGIAAMLLTIAAVVEYKMVGSIPSNRVTNIVNIPILTLFVLGVGKSISKTKWLSAFLTKIGTYSMAIYLAHPFVLNVFQAYAPTGIWKTTLFPIVFVLILLLTVGTVKIIQLLPYNQYILTIPKIKSVTPPARIGRSTTYNVKIPVED